MGVTAKDGVIEVQRTWRFELSGDQLIAWLTSALAQNGIGGPMRHLVDFAFARWRGKRLRVTVETLP